MSEKTDRRTRKTKEALLREFILLLEEKEIKDISVKELSERADINRGTFYLHYSDIYDMLEQIETELFEEFNFVFANNADSFQSNSPLPLLLDLFHQIERRSELVKVFLGPHGDIAFMNRLTDLVSRYIEVVWEANAHQSNNLKFFNTFVVSGCVGLIKEWLNENQTKDNTLNKSPYYRKSPKEMAELCNQIILQAFDIFSE